MIADLYRNFDQSPIRWFASFVAVTLLLMALPIGYGTMFLLSWIFIYAIATLGFNLLFGYTGMLSFGHAAFFGGGAYSVALLQEFAGIHSVLLLLLLSVLVVLVMGAVFGAVSLRASDLYFSLLILALAQMTFVVVKKSRSITGGEDGIAVPTPHFLTLTFENANSIQYMAGFFYSFVALLFGCSVVAAWLLVRSPFGLTIRSIRENEDRARAMGIPVLRYKWYATVLSAVFVGLAGALYAIQFQHISPQLIDWRFSGLILFMALFGGTNSFLGPIVGAGAYVLMTNYLLDAFPGSWRFFVGLVLVFVVLTMREEGIWGSSKRVLGWLVERRWANVS